MRRITARITPKFRPGKSLPRWFQWRGETYELLQLIEAWTKESEWWRHTGPVRRQYYRVDVRGPHPTAVWQRFTCVIVRHTHGDREMWRLQWIDD